MKLLAECVVDSTDDYEVGQEIKVSDSLNLGMLVDVSGLSKVRASLVTLSATDKKAVKKLTVLSIIVVSVLWVHQLIQLVFVKVRRCLAIWVLAM